MDVEKGRENARAYAEERKLISVANETGMTTEEAVHGVATGDSGVGSSSGAGSVDLVGAEVARKEIGGKWHID